MNRCRSWVAVAGVTLVASWGAVASAGEDADRATARELAKQGLALKKEGKCREAIDVLQRAQALFDAPTHLLAIARCQAQIGLLIEASETYRKLGRAELGPKAPAAFRSAQEDGEKELASLAPKIASLTLDVLSEPAGLADFLLKLDGEVVARQLLGVARLVNPGEHKIEASAPGHDSVTQEVIVKEGEKRRIQLVLRRNQGAAPPATSSAPPPTAPASSAPPPTTPPPPPPAGGLSQRSVGYIAGGIGAVSLLLGGYFGLQAVSRKSDRDRECPGDLCSPRGLELQTDAFSNAKYSNIFFGVGVLGVGAGVALILTSPSPSSSTSSSLRLGPGGATWIGRF